MRDDDPQADLVYGSSITALMVPNGSAIEGDSEAVSAALAATEGPANTVPDTDLEQDMTDGAAQNMVFASRNGATTPAQPEPPVAPDTPGAPDAPPEPEPPAVTDQDEAPKGLSLGGSSVAENAAGAVVGAVSAHDPEGAALAYSVDDARFEVRDGQLKLRDGGALDHEAEPEVTLTLSATDPGGMAGNEQDVIAVAIDVDTGDNALQSAILEDVPENWVLTDGGHMVAAAGSDVDVTSWDLTQLRLTPPDGSSGDYSMTLVTTAVSPDGEVATAQTPLEVEVQSDGFSVEDALLALPVEEVMPGSGGAVLGDVGEGALGGLEDGPLSDPAGDPLDGGLAGLV